MNKSTWNDAAVADLLLQIAAEEWNGPGTNKRVERFLLERKVRMNKKQKLTVAGIVALSSLLSAGVAAAVTHQIVSYRVQFVTDTGATFEGELITPMNPGNSNATFVTDDGSVYELRMDSGDAQSSAKPGE